MQPPHPPSNNDPILDIEHILKYRTRKGEKQSWICLCLSIQLYPYCFWVYHVLNHSVFRRKTVFSQVEKLYLQTQLLDSCGLPDRKTWLQNPPSSPPPSPSPSPGPSHQTNAISFVRSPRLFSSLVQNPLPYVLLMISLFTISHAFFATSQLGPLYDCSHIKHNAIFRLPQTPNCSHSMYDTNHSVQYFYADVRQPFTQHTPITLFHCIADIREYRCHENFFGSKSKHFSY